MSTRVEKIIKELGMYQKAENAGKDARVHDTVIHELHTELDMTYDVLEKNEIKNDIKEFENYLEKLDEDHHKKQVLHEIIAYIENKL